MVNQFAMKRLTISLITCFLFCFFNLSSQTIPLNRVVDPDHLSEYLTERSKQEINNNGTISEVMLAEYFRTKFSQRYFYNWKDFEKRFKAYKEQYPGKSNSHETRAKDHLSKYADSTN